MVTQVLQVDVKRLRSKNVRKHFDPERLEQLAAQIKAHGVLEPLIVQKVKGNGSLEIVAGERRWRAAKLAGLAKVPCLDQGALSELDRLRIQASENLGREDLTPLEEGEIYEQLLGAGMKVEDLCKEFGRSKTYVNDRRRLAGMPAPVLDLVKRDKITITHAQALVGLGERRQTELAQKAAAEQLTPGELREVLTRRKVYLRLPDFTKLKAKLGSGHPLSTCATCEKVVAGCKVSGWESGCPWSWNGFGPAPIKCRARKSSCKTVALCPDGECRAMKARQLVQDYKARNPEHTKLRAKQFGQEGREPWHNEYNGRSKYCRQCSHASRWLEVDWRGVHLRGGCGAQNCPGSKCKDPAKYIKAAKNADEVGELNRQREAEREKKRQAQIRELSDQLPAVGAAALDRALTPNDWKAIGKAFLGYQEKKSPEARFLARLKLKTADLESGRWPKNWSVEKRIKTLVVYRAISRATRGWDATPKGIGSLIRELGGKAKAPPKPKPRARKAKLRLKK